MGTNASGLSDPSKQLATQWGIDPNMLTGGVSYGSGDDDMRVFKGTSRRPTVVTKKTGGKANVIDPKTGAIGEVEGWSSGYGPEEEQDETDTVGNFKKEYYRKPPGELGQLKRRLWEAGMYDASVNWEDIRQNDYDDDTRDAWGRALGRAAAFYDAGRKLTVDEVIEMARQDAMTEEERLSGKRSTTSGPPRDRLSVRLTHPDDIKTEAMKVSAKILGRGWSEDQLNRFVATFQSMERAAQAQQYGATGEAGGTYTAAPDMATAAENEARRQDPVAAGATDYVGAYNMILEAFQTLGAGATG